ncbi:MAG: hypothetical protein AAB504_02540 [Patescibacteria group bacterium]
MNPDIFKAYDIRGKYPEEINEKIVSDIIAALIKNIKPKVIVIGHDARLSSPSLYSTIIKQFKIENLKLKIISAEIITTPMLYFLVNYFKADIGIMITASHNPKEYNGLKIVGKKAIPISGKKIFHLIDDRGHDEIKIKNRNE